MTDPPTFLALLWGTLALRPYVFIFLIVFLVAGARDLGPARTVGFLLWGWAVAFASEYASTRIGVPFGLYHYTGSTMGRELYLSNVPLFDSLSFPFLAYAAYCLARRALGAARGAHVILLAGAMMMLLDMVIDPLAVRGARWFLGEIFYYPAGGVYFGVPLSNFLGWALVGWVIVGGYVWASGVAAGPAGPGIGLYYGVLCFNLMITMWIGEWTLAGAGILVHVIGFLIMCGLKGARPLPPAGGSPASRNGAGAGGTDSR
ncbi:MAG TPA: carotenoid biosynthesis protein [Methylomirabilota bacterium]|nr:carotenoid biosynthesis protein [Methylomirabilota bacterium]